VIDDGHLTTFAVTETSAAFRLTATITLMHDCDAAIGLARRSPGWHGELGGVVERASPRGARERTGHR